MERIIVLSGALSCIVLITACVGQAPTSYAAESVLKRINCIDRCFYAGTVCHGKEIYLCFDSNGDGCLEDDFIESCLWNEECIDGKCLLTQLCGNGICDTTETCQTCPKDCKCSYPQKSKDYLSSEQRETICGDGICSEDETCQNCQRDCGHCTYSYPVQCGDGLCNGLESCESCEEDCGFCNYAAGHSCFKGSECRSGYCVNSVCRSSPNYCGDQICDESENCTNCQEDCGKCKIFYFKEAYSASDSVMPISLNTFILRQSGNVNPEITNLIYFDLLARQVTHSFACKGINGTSFYASSIADTKSHEDYWLILNKSNFTIRSAFAPGSARPFVLSSGMDHGTRINITGNGTVRLVILIQSFPPHASLNCTFGISSTNPPYTSNAAIELHSN